MSSELENVQLYIPCNGVEVGDESPCLAHLGQGELTTILMKLCSF
jgi:hypothetical protein